MKSKGHYVMEHTTLAGYIDYAMQPILQHKVALFLGTVISATLFSIINFFEGIVTALSTSLFIHSAFIISYAGLSTVDWFSGFVGAIFVDKQKFNSAKFFKKPFLTMFCILMIFLTVSLTRTFNEYDYHSNPLLQGTLQVVVFLFEGIKIGLMVSFVVYELTSIRENFMRLKWYDAVKILDLFLIPFTKIRDYLDKKFDKVIEDDLANEATDNIDNP